MRSGAEEIDLSTSNSSGLVDFLRHLHEYAAPVLSWHSVSGRSGDFATVKADRVNIPLKRVVKLSSELVIDSPRDLVSLVDISTRSAERLFDESEALQEYLLTCAVQPKGRNVLLSEAGPKGEIRQAMLSFGFSLEGREKSGTLYKVSELEKRHQAMLDAETWTASISKILEAWSIGILRSRKIISISGTDRNRVNHCRATVLKPSPLHPFVPGLRLSFASQKGRNLVLTELTNREIAAEAAEASSDVFRRSIEDDTEIVLNLSQDSNLKRLLVDWCLG